MNRDLRSNRMKHIKLPVQKFSLCLPLPSFFFYFPPGYLSSTPWCLRREWERQASGRGQWAQQIALAGLQCSLILKQWAKNTRCDGGPGCAGEGPGRQRAWIPCDETFGAPVGSPAGSTHIPEKTQSRGADPAPSPTSSLELKKTQVGSELFSFCGSRGLFPLSFPSIPTGVMLNRGHRPQDWAVM